MDRYISTIINKFSNLFGIKGQENRVSGLAISGFGLRLLGRSLGLRHGGGSSMAGLHVAVARVSSATAAAVPAPVHQATSVGVPQHCWRPTSVAWHDSGNITD
jgi:hypothetical protein